LGLALTFKLKVGGAAALVVIGSGPFSLWAPEDDVLYRRRSNASRKKRQKAEPDSKGLLF